MLKGVVRVMVTLDDTVSLEKMSDPKVRQDMNAKAQHLLEELDNDALPHSIWNNSLGQMGIYVNSIGLDKLERSGRAITVQPDVTHLLRLRVFEQDGSINAVESLLAQNGFADVELTLNTDGLEYYLDRDNGTVIRDQEMMLQSSQKVLQKLLNQPFGRGLPNAELDPSLQQIRTRIDQSTFYALLENEDVRAIRPVGFEDTRQTRWPEEVLEAAKEHGEAEIMLFLKGGTLYSSKTGYMTKKATEMQARAHQEAFAEILSAIGAKHEFPVVSPSIDAEMGILHTKLSYNALVKLYGGRDKRILSVDLNKPAAWTSLTNSTSLLNMAPAWNAGFRAAGQIIVILDTGVRKNHAFFTTNGNSRVFFEACFGTNRVLGDVSYQSICPNLQANGDSPPGTLNSGEPLSFTNLAACNAFGDDCYHGTHVAGIAAGKQSPLINPSNLQGVGPDALIASAQVFSYAFGNTKATAFNADIKEALSTVLANAPNPNNSFTINMSLGGGFASTNCDVQDYPITSLVANLTSRGIPVVAATGNNSNKTSINWPACVRKVIKVSSVRNNTAGTTLSSLANIANQSNFEGPFLLAPGGGDGTDIRSARPTSTTATMMMSGTSQAAPHVSGIYAAIKAASPGVSVADATAWIVSTGSIPVMINLPAPVGNQVFRRVRFP